MIRELFCKNQPGRRQISQLSINRNPIWIISEWKNILFMEQIKAAIKTVEKGDKQKMKSESQA